MLEPLGVDGIPTSHPLYVLSVEKNPSPFSTRATPELEITLQPSAILTTGFSDALSDAFAIPYFINR